MMASCLEIAVFEEQIPKMKMRSKMVVVKTEAFLKSFDAILFLKQLDMHLTQAEQGLCSCFISQWLLENINPYLGGLTILIRLELSLCKEHESRGQTRRARKAACNWRL